jgi:hypothetical protein
MMDEDGRMNIGYLIFHPSYFILSRRELEGI